MGPAGNSVAEGKIPAVLSPALNPNHAPHGRGSCPPGRRPLRSLGLGGGPRPRAQGGLEIALSNSVPPRSAPSPSGGGPSVIARGIIPAGACLRDVWQQG